MKLYAVKTSQGYIKSGTDGLQCVELEKANVFSKDKIPELEAVIVRANDMGFSEVRAVELIVTEKEIEK